MATWALKEWQEQVSIKVNKLQTVVIHQQLFVQRLAVQSVLTDATVTKPLAVTVSHEELVEQLIPVLQSLAKAAETMCGELHEGMSSIYPRISNMVWTTSCVEALNLAAVCTFKTTV